MNRRPPDPGQQREIQRLLAEQSSWIQRPRAARLRSVAPLVIGFWIAAAVTIALVAPYGQWSTTARVAICAIFGATVLLVSGCLLARALDPERTIRAAVPWSMGREEDFDKPFPDAPLRAVDHPQPRRNRDH